MGWIIAAAVLAFIACLLMMTVSLRVVYKGDIVLTLRVLFIKIRLYPKKKKINLKKPKKKEIKKKDKAKSAENKKEKEKKSAEEIIADVKKIKNIVVKIIKRTFKYLRIHIRSLCISVSTEDAAVTALAYSGVLTALQSLIAILENNANISYGHNAVVGVKADYDSGKCAANLDIEFKTRSWQGIAFLLCAVMEYLKLKNPGGNSK